MEEASFVLTGVNMVKTIVGQVIGNVADSETDPEEGEKDGVSDIDDFDANWEEKGDFNGK